MNNYGLVEKIFQGTGKTCYWRLKTKNITSNQMFKILINDQIQKLKRLSQLNKGDWENTNPKKIPYYFTDNNTSIYNLYPICTYANNWDSLNKKKRENIVAYKQFQEILKKFDSAKKELIEFNDKAYENIFSETMHSVA